MCVYVCVCTKQVLEVHRINDENDYGNNNSIVIYVMRLDSTRFELTFPQAVWYHGFRKVLLTTFLPLLISRYKRMNALHGDDGDDGTDENPTLPNGGDKRTK